MIYSASLIISRACCGVGMVYAKYEPQCSVAKGDGRTRWAQRLCCEVLLWSGIDFGSDRHHVIIYSGGFVDVNRLGGGSGGMTTLLLILGE